MREGDKAEGGSAQAERNGSGHMVSAAAPIAANFIAARLFIACPQRLVGYLPGDLLGILAEKMPCSHVLYSRWRKFQEHFPYFSRICHRHAVGLLCEERLKRNEKFAMKLNARAFPGCRTYTEEIRIRS